MKRTTTLRKLELMHSMFGVTDGKTCGECSNFVSGRYNTKTLRKCTVYGLTHSEASDWAKRWQACGMFNREWYGRVIIEMVRRGRPRTPVDQIEGQTSMWEDT